MAIIGKIREKSWLLLLVVGGAIVTFIFTSQGPGGPSGQEEVYGIGTVYGEKVDRDEFNKKVEEAQQNADAQKQMQENQQAAQQGRQPQQVQADPVDKNRIWNSFVEEVVLKKEYEALGIQVSDEEFDAYLYGEGGFEVLPDIAQAFQDTATKQFDRNLLQTRIDQMEGSDNPDEVKQWEQSKDYYTKQRQKQKYMDILGQGVYVTNLEAKDEYYAQNEKKSVSFIAKSYGEITEDEIKVTDSKLKAFFEKHKGEKIYENKIDSREVRFADVVVGPSKTDTSNFDTELEDLKAKFENTSSDSLFVLQNSEIPYYVPQIGYKPAGDPTAKPNFTYPAELDTVFKSAQIGDVVGPYLEGGSKRLAKVIGMKDKYLTARHILIAAQRGDTAAVAVAQKTTDSIMGLINSGNFEDFVQNYSEDPGSKDKGGKYEDFLDGEMVPEFSNFAMDEPIGKIGYVQTDYGFHIMEVLERKPANVPNLAIVQKTLKPSEETLQELEDEAYTLLEKLYSKVGATKGKKKKIAKFDTIVKRAGSIARPITIIDNDPKMDGAGFTSAFAETEIYKLAFGLEAKVGDIISSPIKDGDRWVVAILSEIRVKGEAKFSDVRSVVEAEYIKQVKYERFKKQMKGKSLESIQKSKNGVVQQGEIIFGTAQLNRSYSFEPEVIGALFSGLKDGKMTAPIKGKQGVFVVRIDKTIKAPEAKNYDQEKEQLTGTVRGGLTNLSTRALVKQAEVVDNRKFFEIGVRR